MPRVARPLRHKSTGSILAAFALASALAAGIAPAAHAQALDDQVVFFLSNNCSQLFGESQGSPSRGKGPSLGENLAAICFGPSGVGSSLGGGAASPQASALSVEASLLQQRLERAKDKNKEGSSSARKASQICRDSSEGVCVYNSAASDDPGGSMSSSRFNLFATGTFGDLDRNATPFEDAYDSSVKGVAVGFDYQFSDAVVAGVVAGYRKQDADFSNGGDFEVESFEPAIYVSVLPSPRTYFQFAVGFGSQNSDVNRTATYEVFAGDPPPVFTVQGPAVSSPDADVLNFNAQFGYDFSAGRFTFGPRAGLNQNRTEIDSYAETGATGLELQVRSRTVKSLQGVAGFYGSGAFSTKSCVIVPQINVEYVHEFEDDPSIVRAQFVEDLRPNPLQFVYQTSVPDSDFGNVDAGVGIVFAHGIQMFVNFRALVGHDSIDSLIGTIGARFEL